MKINSIAIEDHSRDEYHVWDDENYVKGYAALINLDPLFAENNLVTALDTNLGLDVQVFSTSDNQSKIEDAVTSSERIILYDYFHGTKFASPFLENSFQHICVGCIFDCAGCRKIGLEWIRL